MATLDQPLNPVPLCRMEYAQSPDSYFQRTSQPRVLASVPDVNQANGISMTHPINHSNPCFTTYSHYASSIVPGSSNPNMGYTPSFQNVKEGPVFSPTTSMVCTASMRKKHKRHQDSCESPLKKRRLSDVDESGKISVSGTFNSSKRMFIGDTFETHWNSVYSDVAVIPCLDAQSSVVTHTPHNEDMDDTPVESLCDAACRKLQDIDSRLSLDEDIEAENSTPPSNLPTLIMSDLLQESLKKGFEESFTQKMVESMSRPSMELVLWKPQPEFLIDKLQAISRCPKNATDICKSDTRSESAFPNKSQGASEGKHCTSSAGRDTDTMWNREEEEMEL